MRSKLKIVVILLFVFSFGFWAGSSIFNYFTYNNLPKIELVGLHDDSYCAGQVNCFIKSDNDYKVAEVSLFLDGAPFDFASKRVGSKKFSIPFTLETQDLSDGMHCLEIEAVDSSYHANKIYKKLNFHVDNIPLKAVLLQSEFKVDQGRTIYLKIQSNKKLSSTQVKFLSGVYHCYPEAKDSTIYEGFIPLDCEDNAGEYLLDIELQDYVKNNVKLVGNAHINQCNFPRQKGFSVSKSKLEDEKEISMSAKILEEALEKWLKDSSSQKLWTGPFEIPTVVQWIATSFGEIRTTSEKGRYLHKAIDIANASKSVVWASQNGKIIIRDRYLLSGNTVVIDHGLGIFTLYYHLDSFADVEVGDFIKKGSPIGKIGMTGYATGHHLHWELRVNGIAVDPFQWTKKSFWG